MDEAKFEQSCGYREELGQERHTKKAVNERTNDLFIQFQYLTAVNKIVEFMSSATWS